MVFTPNNRQRLAFETAKGIDNPLTAQQRADNRQLISKYGQEKGAPMAKVAKANQLGLDSYDPDRSKLNPMQRYRYQQMRTNDPGLAKTYRKGILARNSARTMPGQAPAAPAPAPTDSNSNSMAEVLFPKSPDLAQYGSANNLNDLWSQFSDPSKSSMYNWRVKQGTEDLNNFLASKGQLDSSAGIRAGSDLISKIGAEESNAAYDRALTAAQMGQTGANQTFNNNSSLADRLERMQSAESLRRERAGNTAWDRRAWVIDRLLNQNPLATAYGASNGQADIYSRIASGMMAGAGGGGGGGNNMPYPQMPFPSIDYSMPNIYGIGSEDTFSTDIWNSIGKGVADYYGTNKKTPTE